MKHTAVALVLGFSSIVAARQPTTILVDQGAAVPLALTAATSATLANLHESRTASACFIGEAGNTASVIMKLARNTEGFLRFRALWSEFEKGVPVLRVKAEVQDEGGFWTIDTTLRPCK